MLKILTLALALLPLSAQDEAVQKYLGKWAGTARVQNKGTFKVTAVIKPVGENLKVSYVSKGGPNNSSSAGVFLAKPKGDGVCYTSNLAANMNPAIPMMADLCLDEAGNLTIKSLMANGSATMSETGKTCSFKIASPLGAASGNFSKVAAKKRKKQRAS
jgi:hypothetical protein